MRCCRRTASSRRPRSSAATPTSTIPGSGRRRPRIAKGSGPVGPSSSTGRRNGTAFSNGIAPNAKWFVGGKLNASYNCLDRHLETRGDKLALIWEGEPGEIRRVTYRELHAEVSKFANALKSLGIGSGDRVAIYLPHDRRGGRGHARLRAHRRRALGRLRRLLRGRAERPHSRPARPSWSSPPPAAIAAAASCR